MQEMGQIDFNEKELGLLCYHHMVAMRFLDERHSMQRELGLTTPESDKLHIEAQDVCMAINDKLEPFMAETGIAELLSMQLSKIFLQKKEVQEITRIIKDLEKNNPSS